MGKHRYSKGLSFLHILHSSISCEIATHTIPKTWEKWIFIARETYGKTQIFQSYWFLTYFMWGINPDNSQNMGKVDFHCTGKVWENTYSLLPCRFRVDENPIQFLMFGNLPIPINVNILWKAIAIIPRLWVFEEIGSYYETQIIHRVWVM